MAPRTSDFNNQRIVEEILAMSLGMEKRMQKSFIQSVANIAEDDVLLGLLEDISTGTIMAVTPEVERRLEQVDISTSDLSAIAQEAMARSGRITLTTTNLEMSFDIRNPRAISAARNLGANLVQNITPKTRETLRSLIADVIDGNMNISQAKALIASRVGLLPQHASAVQRYIDTMLANGIKSREAKKLGKEYAERLLRHRAEVIARTEISRATDIGQQEAWEQARDSELIPMNALRVWITSPDERLCPICEPMEGDCNHRWCVDD